MDFEHVLEQSEMDMTLTELIMSDTPMINMKQKDLKRIKMCWTTTFINRILESMNMSMVDRNTTKNSTRMNQDQEVAECKLTKQGDQAFWMMMYQPN